MTEIHPVKLSSSESVAEYLGASVAASVSGERSVASVSGEKSVADNLGASVAASVSGEPSLEDKVRAFLESAPPELFIRPRRNTNANARQELPASVLQTAIADSAGQQTRVRRVQVPPEPPARGLQTAARELQTAIADSAGQQARVQQFPVPPVPPLRASSKARLMRKPAAKKMPEKAEVAMPKKMPAKMLRSTAVRVRA